MTFLTQNTIQGTQKACRFLLFSLLCFVFISVTADAATIGKPVSNLGLVGWWTFDEGSGTKANDFSGNDRNGTFMNSPTWTNGRRGGAVNISGDNKYVSVADNNAFTFSDTRFTVSFWLKLNSFDPNLNSIDQSLVGKTNYNSVQREWNVFIPRKDGATPGCSGGVRGVSFIISSDLTANWQGVCSNYVPSVGEWVYVTAVSDNGTVYIYINGDQRNSNVAHTSTTNGSANVTIGAVVNGSSVEQETDAIFDDIRIYGRALSAAEIRNLYRYGQATRKSVSNNGLVGHWSFNEGTSTKAHDFSENGNTGTLTNMDATTDWVVGKRGKALDFDGTNDYVEIPHSSSLDITGSAITITAWVKRNDTDGDTKVVFKVPSSNDKGYGMGIVSQKFEFGAAGVTCNIRTAPGGTVLSTGTWYFLAATYDGSICKTFVNGVLDKSSSGTGNILTTPVTLRVGADQYSNPPSYPINASIDDVRVYNRTLSADEIAELYRLNETEVGGSQEKHVSDGLVGYWSFNGKDLDWTANKAWDRSGAGNNGDITNMSKSDSPGPGKVGQALVFDGSNDVISVPYVSSLAPTAAVSFGAWIKTANTSANQRIISKTETGGYQLSLNENSACASNAYCALVYVGGTYHQASIPVSNLSANSWYHAFATYDGETLRLYLDGIEVASNTTPSGAIQYTVSNSLCIGFEPGATCTAGTAFNGSIDEARVYNRALSASEVKQLYLLGK